MIKQKLSQKQTLKLSPQQIQLIKLLEVPIQGLEQRIKEEIQKNPALEEGEPEDDNDLQNTTPEQDEFQEQIDQLPPEDNTTEITEESIEKNNYEDEFSPEDLIPNDDDFPIYKLNLPTAPPDEERSIPIADQKSFRDYMLEQLRLSDIEGDDRKIAEYIIGSLDHNGYLRQNINSIANDLILFHGMNVTPEQVEKVLKKIQTFDPPGVAARNLQECLSIQLQRKLEEKPHDKIIKIAKKIIDDYYNEFTKKHFDKLRSKLGISEEELKKAIHLIEKLNPKPANFYQPIPVKHNTEQITPDFVLQIIDGQPYLTVNSGNIPPLRINSFYKNYVQNLQKKSKKELSKNEKETLNFLKKSIESAKSFIDAINQREETLYRIMKAIIDYQKDFFLTGDESKLKPMILKDIADKTGLDISTVSRVASNKYIQTPYGIFPLKHFFSEGIEKQDGQEVSTRQIKAIIREAIENEDKTKPLTDEQLTEILKAKGYKIARRTVAKYREQMGIPVARLRKKI